jgi:hypothetical protein
MALEATSVAGVRSTRMGTWCGVSSRESNSSSTAAWHRPDDPHPTRDERPLPTDEEHTVSQTNDITWVLFVGQQPETVDFSDPALPPGLDAEKIHPGIALGMKHLAERGWHADLCLVAPDETATETLELQLAARSFDCVVIGGGIRIPPGSLLLFERPLNAVHKSAPTASIAFNTAPQDTADAAARWLANPAS